jgi:hypothetical protein
VDCKEAQGKSLLALSCWHASPNTACLRRDLGNYRNLKQGRGVGYEEVFIRYYEKLDSEYRPERNHGSNVGGHDLTQPDYTEEKPAKVYFDNVVIATERIGCLNLSTP